MALIAWEHDEGFHAGRFYYGEEEPDWRRIVEIPDHIWAEYKALTSRLHTLQLGIANSHDITAECQAKWDENIARDPDEPAPCGYTMDELERIVDKEEGS